MRVTDEQIQSQKIVVLLNGKWCRGAVEADDTEGWVRIPDPLGVPGLQPEDLDPDHPNNQADTVITETSTNQSEEVAYSGWESIPTKKVYGKVELRTIG